ncbi:MAG: HAMP domain-containing sensor histidine kinase [Anditalea sp.]
MKLLERNTRNLLLALPVILVICSVIFYLFLRVQVNHLLEEELLLKKNNILSSIRKGGQPPDELPAVTRDFFIRPIENVVITEYVLSDTLMFYQKKNGLITFRQLKADFMHQDEPYRLTAYISTLETQHLTIGVFFILAFIFGIILISIVVFNRKSSARLWQPFYMTIHELKGYNIENNEPIALQQSTISEFQELNHAIVHLSQRNLQAFQSQKQFIENASHEMQTPLAIIQTKIELLIQHPGLDEQEASLIRTIYETTNRLSRLNKTLLLLAKIDNEQFPEQQNIPIAPLLEKLLSYFTELYGIKMPKVTMNFNDPLYVQANQSLLEILFSNLIKNAIVHNNPDGFMHLTIGKNKFKIENSGKALSIGTEKLFERFSKSTYHEHHIGMGLSIVKQICDKYGFKVHYIYHGQVHRINLDF